MNARTQRRTLVTRDAYSALRNLKTLVDLATEKLHAAELESVDAAIGRRQEDVPLRALLGAVETLRSPKFDAALEEARSKTATAVALHQRADAATNSQ
jgi:ribosomal protein L12E/L44/L45/RPP1/RPP2